uniref:ATP synthase F0 subunit 8 n=1 Tax=Bothriocroton undatum TaxID=65642 RepID=H9M738_9ACAR|nr:ATP synthase F0 subunit 8 [Bothriocroton undatum]AET63055.1 ATP synthase F0 subunit 8 [Bothriocroton undatum]
MPQIFPMNWCMISLTILFVISMIFIMTFFLNINFNIKSKNWNSMISLKSKKNKLKW